MSERFGHPQVLAGLLLVIFVLQCSWLIGRGTKPQEVDTAELFRVQEGLAQWRGTAVAGTPSMDRLEAGLSEPLEIEDNEGYDPNHSPVWYLIASAPFISWSPHGHTAAFSVLYWGWLARIPYVIFGALLGASLWYVARRLYGNQGGYIALTLYCFSPQIVQSSSLWFAQPEIGGAWGAFGAIFTAIAVAHTLYAPREVILWNWRRIALLGLSLAIAVGSQFSLIILIPVALGFMLYLAPGRQKEAVAIWAAACAVALSLLYAAYRFDHRVLWQGMRHASVFPSGWHAFRMPQAYLRMLVQIGASGPAMWIALPAGLLVYALWRRPRYFGNTAPFMIGLLFLIFSFAMPHYPGFGFQLMATPFLFLFVAGVSADLIEIRRGSLFAASIWGLLAANTLWNLGELARVGKP